MSLTNILIIGAVLIVIALLIVIARLIANGFIMLRRTVIIAANDAREDARKIVGALIVLWNNQTAARCEVPGCPNFASQQITALNPPDGPNDEHYVCKDHDHWGEPTKHYDHMRSDVPEPMDMDAIEWALDRYWPESKTTDLSKDVSYWNERLRTG